MLENGVPIHPPLDDSGYSIWQKCMTDYCNAYMVPGEEYHYKGDPFGNDCGIYNSESYNKNGANFRNRKYRNHPDKIGIALDGYKIFGRHADDRNDG